MTEMTAHAALAAEEKLPPLIDGPHRQRLGLISIVACLGGLLFGYDTGVANGAEGPMAQEVGLSLLQLGVVIRSPTPISLRLPSRSMQKRSNIGCSAPPLEPGPLIRRM